MKIAFKIISYLEGISYLLLLFIGVPLKHFMDNPVVVKTLGMPHGLLFIAYIIIAGNVAHLFKWNTKTFFLVLLASIVPFGTFYIDKKYC